MRPLQRVAMGLVIVLVDAAAGGVDLVHDLFGWLLALSGVHSLRHRLPGSGGVLAAAGLAAAVSVALTFPGVARGLDDSLAWFLSLPQAVFLVLLSGGLARLAGGAAPHVAGRLRVLRAVFVALALAPAVLLGGGVPGLLVPLAVVSVAAGVWLVVLLFRISAQEYADPPPRR